MGKRKPPKRRSRHAQALQSPLYRQRVKPNAKRKDKRKLTQAWEPETIIGLFAVERF